jgi:UDP-N-acetylglucosamine:LPS N-acetylglucosamine transferase
MDTAEELLSDSARIRKLETNALKLGRKGAAEEIAAEVLSLIR